MGGIAEAGAEGAQAAGGAPEPVPKEETAVALVTQFEPRAAALVLEEEVREAVIGTAGAAVGTSPLSKSFEQCLAKFRPTCGLMSVLPGESKCIFKGFHRVVWPILQYQCHQAAFRPGFAC